MAPQGTVTPPIVERIILGQTDPNLLLAACHDAAIRVFDVRNNRAPVMTLQPFKHPAAGVVFEPNSRQNLLVAASGKGELCFVDLRKVTATAAAPPAGPSPSAGTAQPPATSTSLGVGGPYPIGSGVVKTVLAHSKGGLSALVAHPHAPLMATGTVSQVVKVWTDKGDAVSDAVASSRPEPFVLCFRI